VIEGIHHFYYQQYIIAAVQHPQNSGELRQVVGLGLNHSVVASTGVSSVDWLPCRNLVRAKGVLEEMRQ